MTDHGRGCKLCERTKKITGLCPLKAELYGYITFCLSTHALVAIWFAFYLLAFINNAAVNMGIQVFL